MLRIHLGRLVNRSIVDVVGEIRLMLLGRDAFFALAGSQVILLIAIGVHIFLFNFPNLAVAVIRANGATTMSRFR